MEVIKKIVNLDQLKSRTPALVPYIKIGSEYKTPVLAGDVNGDLGGIMCNLRQLDKNTADLFNDYYKIKNILRGGVKAMKVVKNVNGEEKVHYIEKIKGYVRSYEFTPKNLKHFESIEKGLITQVSKEDDEEYADEQYIRLLSDKDYKEYVRLGGGDTVSLVEDLIGLVKVPSDITGSRVPEMFYLSQIEPWLYWFEKNKGYKYSTIGKIAYDNASDSEKGTMEGELPKKVLAEHPKFLKLTRTITIGDTTKTFESYYKKVVGDPDDCCVLDEWNERGGMKMFSFLLSKSGVYSDKMKLWQERMDNGDVLVPRLSFPILLTQNYDDNGTMSVYDENIGFNGNEAGDRKPYTDGVKAESKLMTLRTRERIYADNGEILPYIGNGEIPFKLNECKNIAFDEKNKCYIADYIKSIKYFDEEGNTSSTITDGFVEFEYVIGGAYDTTNSSHIKLTSGGSSCSVIELEHGSKTISLNISLAGASGWVLVSNSGEGWIRVSPESGNSGSVSISVSQNTHQSKRTGVLVFGTNSMSNYEEVYVSIMQEGYVPQTKGGVTSNMKSIWFNWDSGLTATTMNSIGEMVRVYQPGLVFEGHVTSSGSDWYVKSKPSFINLSETGGKAGQPVVFRISCDKQKSSGAPRRTGEIVLAITDDSNVTHSIEVQQISGQMYGNGIVLGSSTVELGTGETASKSVGIEFVGQCDRNVTSDVYRFVAVSGDPSNVLITKNTNRFTLTNNNNTRTKQYITFNVYCNLIDDTSLYETLMVSTEPLVSEEPVKITVTSTAQTVNYNKTVVYNVSVSDKAGQKNAWHVETNLENNEGIEITKNSQTKFTVRNLYEGTGVQKRILIWAVYDYDEVPVKSNEVSLTLVPPTNLSVQPVLHISDNYKAFVQLEIWPKSEDPMYAAVITSEDASQGEPFAPNGDIMEEVIDAGSIHRDPNDRYCIRLTNPRYGYQSVTHATMLDHIGKVVWQNAMQYDQIYEFDGRRLITDMLFQIRIYIEP